MDMTKTLHTEALTLRVQVQSALLLDIVESLDFLNKHYYTYSKQLNNN